MAGIGVGYLSASGTSWRNFSTCKRERQSAILLKAPGMCFTLTVNFLVAEIKNSLRSNVMICGHLDEFERQISTTA